MIIKEWYFKVILNWIYKPENTYNHNTPSTFWTHNDDSAYYINPYQTI